MSLPSQPSPYLRKGFTTTKAIAQARLYVTALGLYEVRINGRKVGEDVLAPGWTEYTKRVPSQTYDVTDLLAERGQRASARSSARAGTPAACRADASGERTPRCAPSSTSPTRTGPRPA